MEDQKIANRIIKHLKKNFLRSVGYKLHKYFGSACFVRNNIYEGHLLKIMKAPEPSDILWENLNFKSDKKKWRMVLTTLISAVLMFVFFKILVILKTKLKAVQNASSTGDDTDQYVSIAVSLVAATLVAGANTTLGIFIRKFAKYEMHKTQTKYFVSTGSRLTAILFINMTFTTMLANIVHYSQARTFFEFWRVSVNGLFYDIFFLFITNSYMSSIFNFFDLVWGYKLLKRRKAL